MVLTYLLAARTLISFGIRLILTRIGRYYLDDLAECLQNIVSLSFHVHYCVENMQHCLKTKYDVLIFALFNVQEDEVVYLCLLLTVINLIKRVFFDYVE